MKIGIITLHGENNYGAVLQSIALRIILEKFGTAKIINYSSNVGVTPMSSVLINTNFTRSKLCGMIFSLLDNENNALLAFKPIERVHKFKQFVLKYGNLTEAYSYEQLLNNEMEDFDVYVSGSDQIWNPVLTNMDPVFFSTYAPLNAKKISYASSIGDYKFNIDESAIIKKYLLSFSHISTREENTAQILSKITGKKVAHVLDPTLLLNKKKWKKAFKIEEKYEPYVLVYNMSMRLDIFKIAYSIAQLKGLKVYNIRNWYRVNENVQDKKYINEFIVGAGPVDFLELFYNATYIVTDSFHGTAFSINFNKPFISVAPETGAGRVTSILKTLGLEDRLVYNLEESKKINLNVDIDYQIVNMLLEGQRNYSMNFLNTALGDTVNLEES